MTDPGPLSLRLILPGGGEIELSEIEPRARDFGVAVKIKGKVKRMGASKLPIGLADARTGEIIDNIINFIRREWCVHTCAESGGWPLDRLISALGVPGIGPVNARALAVQLGSWDNFMHAIKQLQDVDNLPEKRPSGISVEVEQDSEIDGGGGKLISRDPIPGEGVSFVTRDMTGTLEASLPIPLRYLIKAVGPKKWVALREWGSSSAGAADVAMLLSFGPPLPWQFDR